MLTFNMRVFNEFKKLVVERTGQLSEIVVAGAVPDMEVYKHLTGQIQGLREGLDLLMDAVSIAEGRPLDEDARRQDDEIYNH